MFGNLKGRFLFFFIKRRNKNFLDKKFYENFLKLESLLGFKIHNPNLYLKAFTHRSYLEINPNLDKSNERLEFFGDSVLSMVVAQYLLIKFPDEGEGFLTKVRSAIVNRYHLYNAANEINLQDLILFNEKYLRGSQDGFQTIMADTIEALIGAIYLDRGIKKAEYFIHKNIIKSFSFEEEFLVDTNYKGQLLEYCHSKKLPLPLYKVISEEGPSHSKKFTVQVLIGNDVVGEGNGKNKKLAEQEASKNAMQMIKRGTII